MANQNRGERPRLFTPLGVISSFLTLTEVVVTVTLTQTDGGVQVGLAIFVCTFPMLVAGGFFVILWSRPAQLYAPKDYADTMDVAAFTEAIRPRRTSPDPATRIAQRFESAVTSEATLEGVMRAVDEQAAEGTPGLVAEVLRSAIEDAADELVQTDFVTIDPSPFIGEVGWGRPPDPEELEPRRVLYDPDRAVATFLDDIWFDLRTLVHVPAFTYGKRWVLREEGGRVLSDLGRDWARAHGDPDDTRTLYEAGIRAGTTLEVVRPGSRL